MTGSKEDYLKYRIERSKQTLEDAKMLIEKESLNSAINRLYYACFYSVHALLQKNQILTKSHSGTKSKFFQEFIHTGKIPKELGELYSDLFDWRQEGDYSDFIEFDHETVDPLPQKVATFIETLEKLL